VKFFEKNTYLKEDLKRFEGEFEKDEIVKCKSATNKLIVLKKNCL
jgi:hypothetical protein